jgi:hypothetical protein
VGRLRRRSSSDADDKKGVSACCLSEWRLNCGDFERRVVFLPSLQHLPSEGPVRQSHLVPKTSLDGGDAALARSGSAGVFDVTVDGQRTVGLRVYRSVAPCWIAGFPKSRAPPIKGGRGLALFELCLPHSVKTLAAAILLLLFFRCPLSRRSSGACEADRSPPPTVRSNAVLFFFRYAAGRRLI